MLTAQEIKNVIEKAEKRIEELQALLSTVEVEPGDRQAKGEIYYYLDDVGYVELNKELLDEFDNELYEAGNYYLTKEDASR